MSNLESIYNLYVNLAKSTYPRKPRPFVYELLPQSARNRLDRGYSVPFTFPHAKDAYGNDASKVYLQSDKLETVTEKDWFGKEKTYQKIL